MPSRQVQAESSLSSSPRVVHQLVVGVPGLDRGPLSVEVLCDATVHSPPSRGWAAYRLGSLRMLLPESFTPLWSAPVGDPRAGLWFIFHDGRLLVLSTEHGPDVPAVAPGGSPPMPVEGARCIGLLGEAVCWAAATPSAELSAGAALEPLRKLFDRLPDETVAIAGRAAQVLEFDRTHRHCGACATLTELADGGRARRCPACGAIFYPRLAPAMMVLITRETSTGRELLLARGARFAAPIYSALAGFVEPSETLEDCIHREVREEVGVRIRNLRYFGSQCWPFPHSLMVAFLAEYGGGEITWDPSEIQDAQWFPMDRLPLLPHRLSVARRLIEHAVLGEPSPDGRDDRPMRLPQRSAVSDRCRSW